MDDLWNAIAAVINRDSLQPRINPAWVANEALMSLDPTRISPTAVYNGCLLQARQVARGMLRGKFETEETSQHSLFPDLQPRYPVKHEGSSEPEYILLEQMSDGDIEYNVERLRSEAEAKLKHADALEEYGRRRKRSRDVA